MIRKGAERGIRTPRVQGTVDFKSTALPLCDLQIAGVQNSVIAIERRMTIQYEPYASSCSLVAPIRMNAAAKVIPETVSKKVMPGTDEEDEVLRFVNL